MPSRKTLPLAALLVLWVAGVVVAFGALERYSSTPGAERVPEAAAAAFLGSQRHPGRPLLVMAVHPRCPLTDASLAELGDLLARSRGTIDALLLEYQAPGSPRPAATVELGGVRVPIVPDLDGAVAATLGAETSGHCVFVDAQGAIRFHGGLTLARGHRGRLPGPGCDPGDGRRCEIRPRIRTGLWLLADVGLQTRARLMNVAGHFSSLTAAVLPAPANPERQPRVVALFNEYEREVITRTNQFFTWLLPLQWAFGLFLAAVWSPRTWSGADSAIHPHLIAAVFLGGLLTLPPLWLMRRLPYSLPTRHVVAVAQMGFSALLIDLTGGRIETHFHVFGSLAFLALYRDWRVLPTATLVVALDHLLRGIWFPESVYGVPFATVWRTAEHSGWVIFEDVVLVWACLVSRREMWEICLRHDQNECLLDDLDRRVRDRTRDLEAEVREHERTACDLRRSEERYRQLIGKIPIGIVETTRSGGVHLANPHIRSLLGLNGEDASEKIALADGRVFPVVERQRFWNLLESKREVRGFETIMFHASGRPIHVVLNARLRPGPEAAEAICEGTIEDVTERKQAAEKLEALNRQLVEASRQAGQADVATGVLHNVGNVLTSVNLIIHDVQDRLKSTRLSHLHLLVGTLQKERHRLVEFLAADPVGRALPDFLAKLDANLGAENRHLCEDVETLVGHFAHIREIIVVQQSSARLFGVTENIAPALLVDDALRLNADSFARHGITLHRALAEVPLVKVDRHKVLQILVNLLKNAKDSVLTAGNPERRITVGVSIRPDRQAAITVKDNGAGIAPENMVRIFQQGFTTKKDGHGFGLHSCILAAREVGGDLLVTSDGPGRGAAFSLLLPTAESAAA